MASDHSECGPFIFDMFDLFETDDYFAGQISVLPTLMYDTIDWLTIDLAQDFECEDLVLIFRRRIG